jgi:hypothetical protein
MVCLFVSANKSSKNMAWRRAPLPNTSSSAQPEKAHANARRHPKGTSPKARRLSLFQMPNAENPVTKKA